MESTTRRLGELIRRSRELARAVESIQANITNPPPQATVRLLRDEYLDWYTDCLILLPDDLKPRFEEQYNGPGSESGIAHFFRYALATYWVEEPAPGLHWSYPFETSFEARLAEQRFILLRAQKQL